MTDKIQEYLTTLIPQASGEKPSAGESSAVDRRIEEVNATLTPVCGRRFTGHLFEKEGRVVLFTSLEDLSLRIDDPALDVTADDILVLQHAGPTSSSGMPEAGYLPIPRKLAQAGVKDMVRVSDARMSGTAFGTIVLHVAPESAAGGPLALVRNGDRLRLSVRERSHRSARGRGRTRPPTRRTARTGTPRRTRLRQALPGPRAAGRRRLRLRLLARPARQPAIPVLTYG